MSENEPQGDFKFLIGLFLGGLIGAFVIFFLGTKEGKRVGKDLKDKGEDFFDDITDRLSALEEKGEEIIKEGKTVQNQLVEDVKETKDEITTQVATKLDDTLAQIETIQEQGLQQTADLRKRLFRNLPTRRR